MPHATLDEIAGELDRLGEVRVRTTIVRRTLRAQGTVRTVPASKPGGAPVDAVAPVAGAKRYGVRPADTAPI
jgi:hypothetical protein